MFGRSGFERARRNELFNTSVTGDRDARYMRGMQSGEEANCEVCEVAMRKAQRAVGPQFACVLMIAPLVETGQQ